MSDTAAFTVQPPVFNDRTGAIRALAMDAVQKANSGHPGAPMGMAEIADALWNRHLRHNPANPTWPDRDRFVLSNGHEIPQSLYAAWNAREKGAAAEAEWRSRFERYADAYPQLGAEFERRVIKRALPGDWRQHVDGVLAKAWSSASTASANRRRRRLCSRNSGSPSKRS